LVSAGDNVLGVAVTGTWYDFGSPELYLRSHMSLLSSGFRTLRPSRRRIHKDARVAPGAIVERSVVGAGCVVGPGARIVDSVLWDGVRVGAQAQVRESIVTHRVAIAPEARHQRAILAR